MTYTITTFFTQNGAPKTGLTPVIDIYENDGTAAVSSDSMTEVAVGFYKYDFSDYDAAKSYVFRADGGSSLVDNERYAYGINELKDVQADLVTIKNKNFGGGGTIIEHHQTSKKEKQFREDVLKILKKLLSDISTMKGKSNKDIVSKVSSQINEAITTLVSSFSGVTDKSTKILNDKLKEFITQGMSEQNKLLSEINSYLGVSIDKRGEHLPDLIRQYMDGVSKMSSINFVKVTDKITNINSKLDSFNTQVSKMSEKDDVAALNNKLKEELSKIQNAINNSTKSLATNLIDFNDKLETSFNSNKELIVEKSKNSIVDINALAEIINSSIRDIEEKSTERDSRLSKITNTSIGIISSLLREDNALSDISGVLGMLKSELESIKSTFNDFSTDNVSNLKKITTVLPKLTEKRDLLFVNNELSEKLKGVSVSHTKKINSLKEEFSNMDSKTKDKLDSLNKNAQRTADNTDIDSQLRLLNKKKGD